MKICALFQPGVAARRNIERETCLKSLLDEMCQLLQLHTDDAMSAEVKERAAAVVYSLSAVSFAAVFARFTSAISVIAVDGESNTDMAAVVADIELIQHVHIDKENVTKVIKEITQRWPFKKEHLDLVCGVVSAVIWSWIDGYPEEFSTLQHTPEDELTGECPSASYFLPFPLFANVSYVISSV
jgi:neurofibromin 1